MINQERMINMDKVKKHLLESSKGFKDKSSPSSQEYSRLLEKSPDSKKTNPFNNSKNKWMPFSLSRDKYAAEKALGESFFKKEKEEIEKERKEKEQKNLIDL